jgi:hypothetical protein
MLPPARSSREARIDPTEERRLPYDRKFYPAVVDGVLTAQQAIARGNRQAMAERVVREHGLPLELALWVTDNRITIADARAAVEQAKPARIEVSATGRRGSRGVIVVGSLLLGLTSVTLIGAGVLHAGRPHLMRAQALIEEFERGKVQQAIDYADPVYEQAVSELDRVPKFSRYYAKATALREEIRLDVKRYRAALEMAASQRQRNTRINEMRRATFAAAVRRDRLHPEDDDSSECESHP